MIYLDANASYGPTEAAERVISDWRKFAYNPSALHTLGQRSKAALEEVRDDVRRIAGAAPKDRVIFNSGATEGNNTVGLGVRSGNVVVSAFEHSSVLATTAQVAKHRGIEVRIVSPRPDGTIAPEDVADRCDDRTELVSMMAANNETGYILPIAEIVTAVRRKSQRVIFHSDAVQAVGKIEFNMTNLGIDVVTISAHKFGGLAGSGAIVVKEGREIDPLLFGGPQEEKLRAGSENTLGILTLGSAAREAHANQAERAASMLAARDRFESILAAGLSDVTINYRGMPRLPNTSNVSLHGLRAADLLVALDRNGVMVSTGAACSSGKPKPSHVLEALGHSIDRIRSTIRVSFRADASIEEAERAAEIVIGCATRCREIRREAA